jgi:D-glucosaminate-6-phosphate ammonia-lyase
MFIEPSAWAFALAAGDPPVMVRNHETERGRFFLDPCNLHPGEAEVVARRLVETIRGSNEARFETGDRNGGVARLLRWPD